MKFRPLAFGVLIFALLSGAPALLAHEDKDPVCGMMVEIEKAAGTATFAGRTYYF